MNQGNGFPGHIFGSGRRWTVRGPLTDNGADRAAATKLAQRIGDKYVVFKMVVFIIRVPFVKQYLAPGDADNELVQTVLLMLLSGDGREVCSAQTS